MQRERVNEDEGVFCMILQKLKHESLKVRFSVIYMLLDLLELVLTVRSWLRVVIVG